MKKSNRSCRELSKKTPRPYKGRPTLAVSFGKSNYISVGKECIRELGFPKYITILVNWEGPSVVVMGCQANDSMSFKVPERYWSTRNTNFRIYGNDFVRRLGELLGIGENQTIRFYGILDSSKNAIIIDFAEVWGKDHRIKEDESAVVQQFSISEEEGMT